MHAIAGYLSGLAAPASVDPVTGKVSPGETILFWVAATVIVIMALGLIFAKRAVYAAVSLVGVMLCLAVLYTALDAPFLGTVQVVVYTGAIMMLILFVLMLVGRDSSDATREFLRGQWAFAAIGAIGLAIMLIVAVVKAQHPTPVGLEAANAHTNPTGLATTLIAQHALTLELVATLLVIAALGAVTLTHRERFGGKKSQADVADEKMKAYAERASHIGQLPAPGVYARSNAAANPAITAGGKIVEASIPRVLRIRGQARSLAEASPESLERAHIARAGALDSPIAEQQVMPEAFSRSGLPNMRGQAAPLPAIPTLATDLQTTSDSAEDDAAAASSDKKEGTPGENTQDAAGDKE